MSKLNNILKDKRIITIIISKEGRTIDFEVESDFIPTEEWIDEILEDPQLAECKEFLKQKRFIQDKDGRWNHIFKLKDGICIKLPKYFYNKDIRGLKVDFGTVEGCRQFKIPRIHNGYSSLKEFPTSILNGNKKGHLGFTGYESEDFNRSDILVLSTYNNYYGKLLEKSKKELNINSQYYALILKFYSHILINKIDDNEMEHILNINREIFEQDKDFLIIEEREMRLVRSTLGIEKFKL